jgi:hypothetical protein
MLNKLRTKHSRKILWVLSVIIIISFVFWGSASFFQARNQEVLGKIENRDITRADFSPYYKMAQIHISLTTSPERRKEITASDVAMQAWRYLLLLWKVKKENIEVSDQEVVNNIKQMFSSKDGFSKDIYYRYLKYSLRTDHIIFEEYVRNSLRIDKLFEKYVKIDVTEDEIKDSYNKETQKAKIEYVFIPVDKFVDDITLTTEEIEKYYIENQLRFTEEAKLKIKYVLIPDENELQAQITQALPQISTLAELGDKFSLEIKETPFIGLSDPIEGVGWQPNIYQTAESLKDKELSALVKIKDGAVIFEKVEEKPSSVRSIEDAEEEINETLKKEKSKEKAENLCKELLEKIKTDNITNLKRLAKRNRVEFKKTDYFKYYDYIEGVGLEEKVSKIVFSLEKDQIHSEPILLVKGAYIIKLADITPFDDADFQEKRQEHENKIYRQKNFQEQFKLLSEFEKEAKLKILPSSIPQR